MADVSFGQMEARLRQKYPIFDDVKIVDSRAKGVSSGRKLEYYSEDDSPTNSRMVEVFDPSLQGKVLEDAVLGDLLHAAKELSPQFKDLRTMLQRTKTAEQTMHDKQMYDHNRQKYGETRPYAKWMEHSRLDAFIRGYVVNQWPGYSYTPQQKAIMDQMMVVVGSNGRKQKSLIGSGDR